MWSKIAVDHDPSRYNWSDVSRYAVYWCTVLRRSTMSGVASNSSVAEENLPTQTTVVGWEGYIMELIRLSETNNRDWKKLAQFMLSYFPTKHDFDRNAGAIGDTVVKGFTEIEARIYFAVLPRKKTGEEESEEVHALKQKQKNLIKKRQRYVERLRATMFPSSNRTIENVDFEDIDELLELERQKKRKRLEGNSDGETTDSSTSSGDDITTSHNDEQSNVTFIDDGQYDEDEGSQAMDVDDPRRFFETEASESGSRSAPETVESSGSDQQSEAQANEDDDKKKKKKKTKAGFCTHCAHCQQELKALTDKYAKEAQEKALADLAKGKSSK